MSKPYMKQPCPHCPYVTTTKPFLHPERALELAEHAERSIYSEFPCHQTTESDDEGDSQRVSASKECAGFLALQNNAHGETQYDRAGFEVSLKHPVYEDSGSMYEAYLEQWESNRNKLS